MFEFAMGGLWFRWEALDHTGKRLLGSSLVAACLASVPLGWSVSQAAYRYGYAIGSGQPAHFAVPAISMSPFLACWCVSLTILSGILWWRFSLRQDEMFNRVQNWSIGQASSWTMALVATWQVLAFGGVAPPVSVWLVLLAFSAAVTGFWMVAVRRWA